MPPVDRPAVLAALRDLVPEWRPDRVRRVAYLPGGYANDNYRFEYDGATYALRIARRPAADREQEARFLDLDCAPDVVAFDLSSGHLITRWIAGTLLADSTMSPDAAAEYLRTLHAQIPAGVRRYDPVATIGADLDGTRSPAPLAVAALDGIDWKPTEPIGCHNDLNPWNIVRAEAGWRTLDWEFAGDNDPLFDVVCLGSGLGYDDDTLQRLAAAYQGVSRTAPDALLDTRIAFELREYAWAARQITLGNDRAEIRAQAADSERVLRTLLERRERMS